ncbi:MAG: hypothetical protein E2O43_04520 [Nitrospina sp.]|nr:MAG: hypothetical protein E2O43_04520 [Nitrospina sp.]
MENKILFWVGVIFILTVPIYIGIKLENVKVSIISAICAGFIIFVSKMGILTEISLGPLKGKMQETIQEANATIEQLKTISVASAKVTLTSLMAGGFGGGTSLQTKLDLHDELVESLKNVGFSEQELNQADEPWKQGIGLIYHRAIKNIVYKKRNLEPSGSQSSANIQAIYEKFNELLDFDNWQAPSPNEMKNFLENEGVLNKEIGDWINDYQNFLDTGEIRRRDLFIKQ